MANGQPQNGAVPNGSASNSNAASAVPNNQLQPLQGQQQVNILAYSKYAALVQYSPKQNHSY